MNILRIGVIGPSESEIMPFICKISDRKQSEHAMLKFYSGVYEGVEVVSAFCGVCKVNAAIAAQLLISKFEVIQNERKSLIENFNPLCVDMESASVAHTCYVNNIPFIIIRSVSDNADENGSETFESNMEKAALNSIGLVEELIKKLSMS